MPQHEVILVLDFGSQYNQLIARRVRENKVFSMIVSHDITAEEIRKMSPKGLILSGGPASIYGARAPKPKKEIFELGIPVLGICYGMQAMAHMLGGKVTKARKREYGHAELIIDDFEDLFDGLDNKIISWMSHGDFVSKLPAGVILLLMFLTAGFCSYAIYYTTMISFGEKLANVYPQGQLVSIVNSVNFRILASILVISPLVGFLGIYLSHKIAGPIYRIEKSISGMAAGDLSSHITLRRGDEMVSLADSVNRLTDSLALSITTEKSHIESALKELYTLKELVSSGPANTTRL